MFNHLSPRMPGGAFRQRHRVALFLGLMSLLLTGVVPVLGQSSAQAAGPVPQSVAPRTMAPQGMALAASKRGWKPTEGAKFNVPRAGAEAELRLERQVIDAIKRAKPGSQIKMAMFSFDRMQVADALVAAKKRGVWVQVIVNNHEKPSAQRKLAKALGKRTVTRTRVGKHGKKYKKVSQRRQFFYQCSSSCRGDGDVQHSKFVLFTRTGAAKNVVMLGSLNMKRNGSLNQFNDLLTVNDNKRFHSSLNEIFDEMRRDKVLKNSYRKYKIGKRFQLEVMPFPRRRATARTRWTPKRDPIIKLLNPVSCTGAQTNSGRTIIRVNMHAWDKERGRLIANRLWNLHNAGCDVKIHVGYAGKDIRDIFARPTRRGLVPFRSTGFDTDFDGEIDLYSHAKILLVNGKYNGVRNRKMVVTGSSNFQNGGQYGDELILRVFSPSIYAQYAANWGQVWSRHTHGFYWGVSRARGFNSTPHYTLSDGLGIDSEEWRDR